MSRLTLYQRLKPEIKEALHSEENAKYQLSIDGIVEAFSNTTSYQDLKISDISRLYTFSNLEIVRVSAWDFKYGDNILIKE
jgi:hypothetical protein